MTFEIIVAIDSYKDYLKRSYKLIEDITSHHRKEILFYKEEDEYSRLHNEAPFRGFDFFINESIIITWHSAALIGIISIFEKSMQEYCELKEEGYKKGVEIFRKKKSIGKNVAYMEILWQYVEHKGWHPKSRDLTESMNKFRNYITDRNKTIHANGYIFPLEKYSKDSLVKICDDLKDFLDILFNDGKNHNSLDEI